MKYENPYDLIAACEDYDMAHDGVVDELCRLARNLLKENQRLIRIIRKVRVVGPPLTDEEMKIVQSIQKGEDTK